MHHEICRKKNLNPKQPPTSPLHGKNQTPRIHRKNPPRLAPKTIIPQTRKETIHRDVQGRDPNPSAGSLKTKERIGLRRPHRARGRGLCDRRDMRKPLDLWLDICNHRCTVVLVITSIQGVDDSQGGSAIPRLGLTEEGSNTHRG